MSIGDRLRELRMGRGLTLEQAGAIGSTSKQSMSQIEKGVTKEPGGSSLLKWAKYYGVSLEWLITGKGGDSDDEDYADVIGYSQAVGLGSGGAEAVEYAETHSLKFKKSSLRRRGILNKPLAVYYGKGDSMEPAINDGDAILFDTSDTRVVDGVLYVIQVNGAANPEYYVKRAMVLDAGVYFASDNPNGDHDWRKPKAMDSKRHPITVIGRVHWVGGWAD